MANDIYLKTKSGTYPIHLLKELILKDIEGVIYAGVVGSSLCRENALDVDVSVVVDHELLPTFIHIDENLFALAFDSSWLTYEKHAKHPVGLIPSILFKSLELSLPVVGDKNSIKIPKIQACAADYCNLELKKAKFIHSNRKNYLVAFMFEKILKVSPNLEKYHFDNIRLAKELELFDIADELENCY